VTQRATTWNRYELWRAGQLIKTELELFTLQWYGLSEFSAMLHDAGFPQVTIDADYRAASTRQKAAGCGHSRPPATEIPHPNWPARPSR